MDGTNPKVSFIPKGSLVHQDSFLERSRPRSVIGIIAIAAFVLSIGSYIALYYYNDSFNQIVVTKTEEIKKAQKEFSDAPEVGEAKIFRARAELARDLLNAHTVASPVFEFLTKNTTESILFTRFSFQNDETGSILSLSGEAPSYASLAYQVDVLRGKTKELAGLSVGEVTLTKFGTIAFSLSMAFKPEYLLYTKNLIVIPESNPSEVPLTPSASFTPTLNLDVITPQTPAPTPTLTPTPTPALIPAAEFPITSSSSNIDIGSTPIVPVASTTGGESAASSVADPVLPSSLEGNAAPVETVLTGTGSQSFLQAFWQKFKFW